MPVAVKRVCGTQPCPFVHLLSRLLGASLAELSSPYRGCKCCNPKVFITWLFTEKLLTSGLYLKTKTNHCSCNVYTGIELTAVTFGMGLSY